MKKTSCFLLVVFLAISCKCAAKEYELNWIPKTNEQNKVSYLLENQLQLENENFPNLIVVAQEDKYWQFQINGELICPRIDGHFLT